MAIKNASTSPEIISSIENSKKTKPNQPIAQFLQQATNLYKWSLDDANELNSVGITDKMIDELPQRISACREAEARWYSMRHSPMESQKQWKQLAPIAIKLRVEILSSMRYAFRLNAQLLTKITAIKKGTGFADLIQDLNDIAVLGRNNAELLLKIGFDLKLLETAAKTSDDLANLWATAKTDTIQISESKTFRNKTFWYLNELVTEIRSAGRYVFRHDKGRYKGYTNTYWRRKNDSRIKTKSSSTRDTPAQE